MKPKEKRECSYCSKYFFDGSTLKKHIRRIHKRLPGSDAISKACPEINCSYFCNSSSQLAKHMAEEHQLPTNPEIMTFQSEQDFLEWKLIVENETKSCFIQTSGKKKRKNIVTTYYACHRSGYFKSEGAGKRQLKTQGSSKMNGTCPAFMNLNKRGDEYSLTYCKTHRGHGADDLRHLVLTKQERGRLAEQLDQGATHKEILDSIRDGVDGSPEQIHLTTSNDLENIERLLKINVNERGCDNQETNIKIWVQEMRNLGAFDPVLFFKSQNDSSDVDELGGNDFCLIIMTSAQSQLLETFSVGKIICVDMVHGLNSYDFELTTLMVVDVDEVFPVAFLVSNRQDTQIMSFFFEVVKKRVGHVAADIFMCDVTDDIYSAWQTVMGEATRLFCTWQVDRTWRNDLTIVKDAMKQAVVYKYLRVLLTETNVFNFNESILKVLEELKSDPETKEFGEYFEDIYFPRCENWALCFRDSVGVNVNNALEAMHRRLKSLYIAGKKVDLLDRSILSLLKMVRDKLFDQMMQLTNRDSASMLATIENRHVNSDNLNVVITEIKENNWSVQSVNSDHLYEVEKRSNQICCDMVCSECNICLHMYKCTCTDSIIMNTICTHIHRLADNRTSVDLVPVINSTKLAAFQSSTNNLDAQDITQLKASIRSDIQILIELVSQCNNDDVLLVVKEQINSVISLLQSRSHTSM